MPSLSHIPVVVLVTLGFAFLVLVCLTTVNASTTPWSTVTNLPISSSGYYEGLEVASSGQSVVVVYSDRSKIFYATSSDGGISFSTFQAMYTRGSNNVYGLKLAAATNSAYQGQYLMCFVHNGDGFFYELRNGTWIAQERYVSDSNSRNLIQVTGCAVAESKDHKWLAINMIYDTTFAAADMFMAERAMEADQDSWPAFTRSPNFADVNGRKNWLGKYVTDGTYLSCTHLGHCFFSQLDYGGSGGNAESFVLGLDNFHGNTEPKSVYGYPWPGNALALVIGDNVTAQYTIVYDSAQSKFVLKCFYDTVDNINSNFDYSNPHSLPGYGCPDYSISGQGSDFTQWRFSIDAANHYYSGGMVVTLAAIRVTGSGVQYRDSAAFVSTDGWKSFTKQAVAQSMTYSTKFVHTSVTVSSNSFVMTIAGDGQAQILRKAHSLGSYGITTHAANSTAPATSVPSITPTTSTPSQVPSKAPSTSVPSGAPSTSSPTGAPSRSPATSHPSKAPSIPGATEQPSSSPSYIIQTSRPSLFPTTTPTERNSGGTLSSTATSVLAITGAAVGFIAIFALANAVLFISRYGDDMRFFRSGRSGAPVVDSTLARNAVVVVADGKQDAVGPYNPGYV